MVMQGQGGFHEPSAQLDVLGECLDVEAEVSSGRRANHDPGLWYARPGSMDSSMG